LTGFLVAASNTTCGCAAGFVPDHHEDGTNVTTFDQKCTCDKEYYLQGSSCVPCPDGTIKSGLGTGAELCVEPAGLSTAATASIAVVTIVVALLAILAYRKARAKIAHADSKADKHEQEKFAAEAKTQQVQRDKAALQDKLYAAKKLIDQVMEEGGKLLDSYHLDYSDIDFGGDDVKEWRKLGEGAQVV
jgi:hypothetical protein